MLESTGVQLQFRVALYSLIVVLTVGLYKSLKPDLSQTLPHFALNKKHIKK
jgi:hypothetical protein